MNAILRFLFPAAPSSAGASWLLLAARIVFGVLLMTHGIAKWQNFETLSATFPDPLGVGSPTSLVLAIFGEVVCSLGFITGTLYRLALLPMIFTCLLYTSGFFGLSWNICLYLCGRNSFCFGRKLIVFGRVWLSEMEQNRLSG